MFDDLAAYFHENVMESYDCFRTELAGNESGRSRDLRNAISAASAIYHLREHIPSEHRKSRKDVATVCAEYDILGDIVNASKHGELDRSPKYVSAPSSVAEVTETTLYRDEEGEYFHSKRKVVVRLIDGTERDVYELLRVALNFWVAELHSIGVLSSFSEFPPPDQGTIPTRRESDEQRQNYHMIQGVRFLKRFRFRKFDYESGTSKPWDMGDAKLQFKMWKPRFKVELIAENSRTGQSFSLPVELTDEECFDLNEIEDEQEQQKFIHEIAVRWGVPDQAMRRIEELGL